MASSGNDSSLTSMFSAITTTSDKSEQLLVHTEDQYGGVLIDASQLPESKTDFTVKLAASLTAWKKLAKRGIWLKVPIECSDFIASAVKEGFEFHHAETNYVMMTKWLADVPSTIPPNASHQVGVGAFVLNSKNEVLVVQETSGPAAARKDFWKLPTGLVNQGEEIADGAIREVLEECGIRTKFLSMVGMRSAHNIGACKKSDLFFVCTLQPLSEDIKIQESEIAAAKWMDVEEWLALDFMKDSLYKQMYEWSLQSVNGSYVGMRATEMPIGFRPGTNMVYHMDQRSSWDFPDFPSLDSCQIQ
ncbi:hypothetical protein CYMTET_12060 [Cymbomonas tetramitiformis]|uniref:Nudix hydrolase domain-containing protein n=1 Tax=Cymbomonas tetramitiformis TaxID=36881 RepID=A0AAE0GLF1_9CHLO|nr:hypothetical protein CYMTET_12060 [Cymbomonas tetramitiformis]